MISIKYAILLEILEWGFRFGLIEHSAIKKILEWNSCN